MPQLIRTFKCSEYCISKCEHIIINSVDVVSMVSHLLITIWKKNIKNHKRTSVMMGTDKNLTYRHTHTLRNVWTPEMLIKSTKSFSHHIQKCLMSLHRWMISSYLIKKPPNRDYFHRSMVIWSGLLIESPRLDLIASVNTPSTFQHFSQHRNVWASRRGIGI